MAIVEDKMVASSKALEYLALDLVSSRLDGLLLDIENEKTEKNTLVYSRF